jgi:glucokinase
MLIGIEIGGTKLQLVLGDEQGNIHQQLKLVVNSPRGASGIREQIQAALPKLIGAGGVDCIGVGFGGPVDWKHGKICRSHQIEGWSEFDLAGWLHGIAKVPVRVDNDANVAALGEARKGAGCGNNPVFYVTLGSGVGGGLVLDGKIYHGASPGEAEIGHVRLDRQGTIVESRCSGWAVDSRIRALQTSEPASLLCRMPDFGKGGEAKYLSEAFKQGDAAAARILSEMAQDLAFGLSHVVHLFHPEVIVLGGGLSGIGEPLRQGVERELPGFVMGAFAPGPRVVLAALWEDAVPTGALLLAAQQ